MRVSEKVTQVFLRAFRLPGRQQLPKAAAAAVPAGELVVTAQLPFAAVPLPAAPLLQIGRQLCSTQTPQLRLSQMRPNSPTSTTSYVVTRLQTQTE